MIGLGILGHQPVSPYQARLVDGIHLRWGFLRELGFPWYGFYLFRRPSRTGTPLCLSSVTGGLKKGNWPDNKYYTPLGLLSSDANLVFTEDFTPGDRVEFALDGRNSLRFELPAGESASRIELRIGFRSQRCLDFKTLISPPAPPSTKAPSTLKANPLALQGATFEVKGGDGKPSANTGFDWINTTTGQLPGLGCGYGLTIKLSVPSNAVELLLTRTVEPPTVEAFDANNNKVATAQAQSPVNQPETIKLTGQNISRIEVRTIRNTVYLYQVCSDKFGTQSVIADKAVTNVTAVNRPPTNIATTIIGLPETVTPVAPPKIDNVAPTKAPVIGTPVAPVAAPVAAPVVTPVVPPGISVKVLLFAGTTLIRNLNVSGQAGQVVSTTLEADGITAVEIGTGTASLVDLCYVPLAQEATQGWERLPEFSYPMGLPVTQASYPCSVANPQSLLTTRVHYPMPPAWDTLSFTQLHIQLVELVKGGPGTTPMADRIFAAPPGSTSAPDPNPPQLTKFYVLDLMSGHI
jgi:hypothetical protein